MCIEKNKQFFKSFCLKLKKTCHFIKVRVYNTIHQLAISFL